MSVGTTDTWASSRDDIINDALANVGAVGPGVSAVGPMRDHAARALDRIVKAIDGEGQFLWRMSRLTTSSVASQASYTLSALAFDVDEPVSYMANGGTTRVPLAAISRDEYMAKPDRTSTSSTPSNYYIEKTLSSGRTALTMYLYPTPSGSGDTIEYVAALRAKDFNTGATNPDFPSAWHKALVYGLTAELAPSYGQPDLMVTFGQLFEAEKGRQINNDTEKLGITFVPFGGWTGNYGG